MKKKYVIALVGATGNVGREVLNYLASRNFPVKQNYVSLQLCDGMSEMRAATRNERGSIFLT